MCRTLHDRKESHPAFPGAKHAKNNRRGFTLIEMLVVIAVIAILVSIAIPTVTVATEKAREAVDLSNVRSAYSKVMLAAMMGDTSQAGDVTYMHDRWYINVNLTQQKAGWQSGSGITISGITPSDSLHWVGNPAPGSVCTVSYSSESGAVLAWVYNFAEIMNTITVPGGSYDGQTVTQMLHEDGFTMLESSGSTGRLIGSEIKHQLGLNTVDDFSYKILPARGMGSDYYEIYISTDHTLKTNAGKNQSKVGSTTVTGYIYKIEPNGASTLVKVGTPQEIDIYTNGQGQEKLDVYGDQNAKRTPTNRVYTWDD